MLINGSGNIFWPPCTFLTPLAPIKNISPSLLLQGSNYVKPGFNFDRAACTPDLDIKPFTRGENQREKENRKSIASEKNEMRGGRKKEKENSMRNRFSRHISHVGPSCPSHLSCQSCRHGPHERKFFHASHVCHVAERGDMINLIT